jgi:hypothetical protein
MVAAAIDVIVTVIDLPKPDGLVHALTNVFWLR